MASLKAGDKVIWVGPTDNPEAKYPTPKKEVCIITEVDSLVYGYSTLKGYEIAKDGHQQVFENDCLKKIEPTKHTFTNELTKKLSKEVEERPEERIEKPIKKPELL